VTGRLTALPDGIYRTLRSQHDRATKAMDGMDKAVARAEDEFNACQEVLARAIAERETNAALITDIETVIGAKPGEEEIAAGVRGGWGFHFHPRQPAKQEQQP